MNLEEDMTAALHQAHPACTGRVATRKTCDDASPPAATGTNSAAVEWEYRLVGGLGGQVEPEETLLEVAHSVLAAASETLMFEVEMRPIDADGHPLGAWLSPDVAMIVGDDPDFPWLMNDDDVTVS
jgi:hypothetical protein